MVRAALLVLALAGCGPDGSFVDGVYRDREVAYRVGPLAPAWRRVRIGGGHLAFHHHDGGSILANATCERIDDVPLDVLTNHLLFGIERRAERSRTLFPLDGRSAIRTVLDGSLDGVAVTLDLVVVKKDGCVYDLQLIAGPAAYPARRPDFDRLLAGFAKVQR